MGLLKKSLKWGAKHRLDNKVTGKLDKKLEKINSDFEIKVKEVSEKYDIREGINVTVITPEIEIITKNISSDLMKTLATFNWGVAGYAMTNGKKNCWTK